VKTLSIIIPFFNEEESVEPLLREVQATCPDAEIVAVDDGSSDGTLERIQAMPGVRPLALPFNLGQSAALYAGLIHARGCVCVMLDGDGQNDPADIPALVASLEKADFVCGYRQTRQDSCSRRIASRMANSIRRFFLKDQVRDTGCSLKAMRREHVGYLVPFNGLHRYIPALLLNAGLTLVEVPVNHRPRIRGVSKYTIGGRALRGLRDLFGVSWLMVRQIRYPAGVLPGSEGAKGLLHTASYE
jgi:dolichol-phosphate mannosyltransferase